MSRKRFVVDLGRIKMSENAIKHVETEVQKAALAALAEVDHRGDLIARFPNRWLGLWIDNADDRDLPEKEVIAFAGR